MKHFIKSLALVLVACSLTGCCLIRIPTQTHPETSWTEQPGMTAPRQDPTEEPAPSQQTEPTAPVVTEPAPTEPVTAPPTVDDHAAQIKQIRSWYQDIISDPNLESKTYADAATIYWQDGQIVSIAEYRQLDDSAEPAEAIVHFYYHDSVPFFVLIEYENHEYEEVRLYFANGKLIRWIIDENTPKDNIPNTEWEGYYAEALSALQNAPTEFAS